MKCIAEEINLNYAIERGIFGKGIGIAVMDTGISPHDDFTKNGNRIIAFKDILKDRISPYDDNGHGTHVAGIIAGDGFCSNKKYCGIAPKSNIISVKVLDNKGNGDVSDVILGINWIINNKEKYNIRIVNISVGSLSKNKMEEESILVRGVNSLWDNGLVVVTAAGNNGPSKNSISTPGISRKVITVGASDDYITVKFMGNRMKNYSGRGPTYSCIVKPEVIAPGSNIISCTNAKTGYTLKSGTSMATPIVSGVIALLLEKYPYMTPKDVKLKIYDTSKDLGLPKSQQGWGLIDVKKLLE